ncbi:Acetyltransferase aurG [Pseudocercospora fuligena]|uniref:Acetyltransferase aurG n=1 Tax=Pseudocercospora fuligena TaxID=685502 RepID=A0A8H6RHM1_9PEZI|nr:Acetyltransferase aurG [Pseudocercospora fuligena]
MVWLPFPQFFIHAFESAFTGEPRPGLKPIPGTKPLTLEALLCPVLLYYIALLLLPPPPPPTVASVHIGVLRNILAGTAAYLFLRLPLAYHVPQSIGLTYQLGLVGLYGGLRVLDAFFVSYYGFGHIPRRVRYSHQRRPETPIAESAPRPWADGGSNGMLKKPSTPPPGSEVKGSSTTTGADTTKNDLLSVATPKRPSIAREISKSDLLENMTNQSYTDILSRDESYVTKMKKLLDGPKPIPVIETAHTEDGYPHGFTDRASWALELELSMRGVGFTWTTADVRHTTKTWLPTVQNRIHSVLVHVGPVIAFAWIIIKTIYVRRLAPMTESKTPPSSPFDELSYPEQYLLTVALGAFLMAAFSLGHSLFAIICSPLAPSPLAFFPPLYTTRVWDITSARRFWSYGWHRLFARLFLVWGVWPGEWVERKLTGKRADQPADVGKVLGGFFSSALVHSFAVRGTLGGNWTDAAGEAKFFALNGIAVILEEAVTRAVRRWPRGGRQKQTFWYDNWIGRVWWIGLLLTTGRNFARGWTKAGLVREMAFM